MIRLFDARPSRPSICFGQVAQVVEQWTENPRVEGATPSLSTSTKTKPDSHLRLSGFLRFRPRFCQCQLPEIDLQTNVSHGERNPRAVSPSSVRQNISRLGFAGHVSKQRASIGANSADCNEANHHDQPQHNCVLHSSRPLFRGNKTPQLQGERFHCLTHPSSRPESQTGTQTAQSMPAGLALMKKHICPL